ncbi:MAG: response regulator [Roseiflexus sp.]|nr:response regulator [Roseiflexus sp.]MCS7290686.1 response regulator [Roseiflexus sp.]MDW8232232.1 response regulator [Roseiflexaceae bacterium]
MTYRLVVVPGDSDELRALQGRFADDVEVQTLATVNEALWEVRNDPPGVIIANVELPGMSGIDLAEILPNFGAPTRLVLWSRRPDPQIARQVAGYGVQHVVSGDMALDDLRNLLYRELNEAVAAATKATEPPSESAPQPPVSSARLKEPAAAAPMPEPPARSARPKTEPSRQPESAPARPAETSTQRPARRRDGPLVLTPEDQRAIRLRMEALDRDVGSKCIILADRAGMVLVETGLTTGLPTMVLLPLLSTSFSTAGQITQILRETESSALYVHEGSHYDLYCFDIAQRFMLVIVFDKSGTPAKIGSVWVYAKRAIRDIQELLS